MDAGTQGFGLTEPVVEGRVSPSPGVPPEAAGLHGLARIRGERPLPLSILNEGRFGRMFRRLSPMRALSDEELRELAERMREPVAPTSWDGTIQDSDNPAIPAGYTYLGQFIDHDLTFDPVSSLERINDPDALHDFRSPRFDLDSVYGSGPIDEPFQYTKTRMDFLITQRTLGDGVAEFDLPRNEEGIALIGDPRNDENVIVSQLQSVFLRLHNVIARLIDPDGVMPSQQRFAVAQEKTRWLYQWVVVHDYLPRTIGPEMFADIFRVGEDGKINIVRPHFEPRTSPYMPIEFSAAAFRFGHSQVRGVYNLNDQVRDRPIFAAGDVGPLDDLRGRRPLPDRWGIDWTMFFPMGGSTPQPSRRIDASLVPALFDLPESRAALAFLNLKRGQAMGLPSGQDVARFLRIEPVLTGDELSAPDPTPLWFYILKESELMGGEHLGQVGGRIVGEVLLGLFELDRHSWIQLDPTFNPRTEFDLAGDGEFAMADLIAMVM
jgi:hypothetical protein